MTDIPTATSATFPYQGHRTMAEVMREEWLDSLSPSMAKRNLAIIMKFIAGSKITELAAEYGLSSGGINYVLRKGGVPADHSRGGRVSAETFRAFFADPVKGPAMRKMRSRNASAWRECPDDKWDDYQNMRHYMPAAEARSILEGV